MIVSCTYILKAVLFIYLIEPRLCASHILYVWLLSLNNLFHRVDSYVYVCMAGDVQTHVHTTPVYSIAQWNVAVAHISKY